MTTLRSDTLRSLALRLLAAWMLGVFLLPAAQAKTFRQALPGYQFRFPADHASHNEFKTEWWYYTGHLKAASGAEYGFELTFFRSSPGIEDGIKNSSWSVDQLYLAHFAVTDLARNRFFHTEKMTRPARGTAGADQRRYRVWNHSWSATLKGDSHELNASSGPYAIELELTPAKPPAIHGIDGASQKASCVGCASHYYSLTRLKVKGRITVEGKAEAVTGQAWMDHEFGSNQLAQDQVGWDWLSIQLDDGVDLMLYVMRRQDGSIDANSAGTLVLQDGKTVHITHSQFSLMALASWTSPESGGRYPMKWDVKVPSLGVDLTITPRMKQQELFSKQSKGVTYWEGACAVSGLRQGTPVTGRAYVELTGYAEPFRRRI